MRDKLHFVPYDYDLDPQAWFGKKEDGKFDFTIWREISCQIKEINPRKFGPKKYFEASFSLPLKKRDHSC
jgi:hypothetical protein